MSAEKDRADLKYIARLVAERDALTLQIDALTKERDILKIWGEKADGAAIEAIKEVQEKDRLIEAVTNVVANTSCAHGFQKCTVCDIKAILALKRVVPVSNDTCENVRKGDGEIVGKFCKTYESSEYPAHSPTCQFFRK